MNGVLPAVLALMVAAVAWGTLIRIVEAVARMLGVG